MATVESLIEEFNLQPYPDRSGAARDLVCTQCGQRHVFNISGVCFVKLRGDGAVDDFNYEYHNDSFCQCPDCGNEGLISDFKFKGLDDALEAMVRR